MQKRKIKNTDAKSRLPFLQRWWRRLLRIAIVFLVLFVILRIGVLTALPWFLERSLATRGFDGSYERLRVHLLAGDAELWHFEIRAQGSAETLVHLEYCRAEISIWTLVRGNLVIPRIEVDGLDVNLQRRADGTWTGWENLARLSTATPRAKTKPPRDPNRPLLPPLNLAPPFKLDALRLQHVNVLLRDEAISPPLDTQLDLNVRLSNLGSAWRPMRYQLTLTVDNVIDRLELSGTASGNSTRMAVEYEALLQGVYPVPIQAYLARLGVYVKAERLDGGLRGTLDLQVAEETRSGEPGQHLAMALELKDLSLVADRSPEIMLGRCTLRTDISDANGIELHSLQLADGRVRVYRDPDAGISLAGIYLLKPIALRKPKPVRAESVPPPPDVAPTPSPSPSTAQEGLLWSVGEVDLQRVELIWDEDRVVDVPPLALTIESGTIGPVTKTADGIQPIPLQAQARVAGVIETGTLSGHCDFMSHTKYVEVDGDLRGVTPTGVGGYLTSTGLESEHQAARLKAHARWSMHRPAPGQPLHNSALLRDLRGPGAGIGGSGGSGRGRYRLV
ncbi:DUF748 domain-containing protein [Planctomycetota bacterium]